MKTTKTNVLMIVAIGIMTVMSGCGEDQVKTGFSDGLFTSQERI